MSNAVSAVVGVITAAFAIGPTPARRESLVYEGTWETDDLIRDLAGVRDRPDEQFIEQHSSSLPAFTAAGLQRVLPQYLTYSLKHPQSDATERVIFHLATDDTASAYWQERLEVFSPAQKSAICNYLQHMQVQLAGERYDAYLARALSVWGCA